MTSLDWPQQLRTLRGAPINGLSDDDFFELCRLNPELRLERTAQQDIMFRSPAGSGSSESSGENYGQLWLWNRQAQLGHVYESSAGFKLPDTSVRSPDAAWLSNAAWEKLTPEQRSKFPPVCPEFMMELKSPSDALTDLQAKMQDYLANRMQLGFLLHIEAETACVYRPGQPTEIVRGYDQELSGEPVLPGFRLDLRPLRRAA
ncbi:Uma2 family endonuclease [Hymenobacter nivis]|uniref:Putative restriction endonuclease domain-containing protein n=1 Tax=Hymenobacter nivis TaxID=1850093 RepID=A0A2Z3GP35_9BACT|nr:Uma2 family endonuclease [Hymenobacter nivis]AWM33437.1 hypothetical protein DDQ68_11970 [Hymenobacter nivis]